MIKLPFIKIMLFLAFLPFLDNQKLWGQTLSRGEVLEKRATFTQSLSQLIPQEDFIQKGKSYKYVYPRVQGSHLLASKPLSSKILYEGMEFSHLSVSYDIYNDLVFTTQIHPDGNRYLILPTHKLDEFWIDQRHFIRLDSSPDSSQLIPGYYHLSYDEKGLKLVTKWKVKRNTYASSIASSKAGQKPYKFVSDNTHFLLMENKVYTLSNKKDLQNAFPNLQELKEFMKENKLKLKNPQSDSFLIALREILEFLNS